MKTDINSLHAEWHRATPSTQRDLYNQLGEAVYTYIERILKREFSAWFRVLQEDAIQESALEVFKDIDKFNPTKADFEQWIYGVTCHTCIDMLRKRKNGGEWGLLDHEALASSGDYMAKHTLAKLREQLTEEENELIDLKLEGLTNEAVAHRLGIEVEATKKRWTRLQEKLRTLRGGEES